MAGANIPKEVQSMVYREAFDTACKLDGLIPTTIDGITKSRYEHWMGNVHNRSLTYGTLLDVLW